MIRIPPPPPLPTRQFLPLFEVGRSREGSTTLRVGDSIITLSAHSVKQLIGLLEMSVIKD